MTLSTETKDKLKLESREWLPIFLHLGRLRAFGTICPLNLLPHVNPLLTITPAERIAHEKAFNAFPQKNRVQIRPLWAQYRSGRKILDMCIEPVLISGFSLLIRHGDEGAAAQVKLIRVIGITTDQKGEMVSLRQICRTVIPKVRANTELYVDFNTATQANIITFEFLCSYGAAEQVPPKIALFS